jgi:hypothetical protein
MKVASKVLITLQEHLRQEQKLLTKDKCGIYKLNYYDCKGCYTGQKERKFKVWYNECTHAAHLEYAALMWCPGKYFDILDAQHKGPFL